MSYLEKFYSFCSGVARSIVSFFKGLGANIWVILVLVGGLFFEFEKNKENAALLENDKMKESTQAQDKQIVVDQTQLDAEAAKRKALEADMAKNNQMPPSVKDVEDFFNRNSNS